MGPNHVSGYVSNEKLMEELEIQISKSAVLTVVAKMAVVVGLLDKIHFQIVIACLLGVLLAPVLANDNMNENNQGNKGGRSQQTVSISGNQHVANIDTNNGWNSWNLVWDDETGFVATRILSKKACIVSKMNKNAMPDSALFPQLIKERQSAGLKAPPAKELLCIVSKTTASDLTPFGPSIQAQCRGVPTYIAHQVQGPNFFHPECFTADLGFTHINYCADTNV
ncbi:gastrokine-1 [Alligator sinensis]|uniref:Gastrokine-1 n=1 Tax=Alligator sinensis TaxID=38654 RepID=A0A1U8DEW9_ALLSI|nr:gastrokine-1 [Alligator sinensis]